MFLPPLHHPRQHSRGHTQQVSHGLQQLVQPSIGNKNSRKKYEKKKRLQMINMPSHPMFNFTLEKYSLLGF